MNKVLFAMSVLDVTLSSQFAWAASVVGQIVIEANAQSLSFFDDDHFRIVKLPIGN